MQEVLAEADSSGQDKLQQRIETLVRSKPVMLFMKGRRPAVVGQ